MYHLALRPKVGSASTKIARGRIRVVRDTAIGGRERGFEREDEDDEDDERGEKRSTREPIITRQKTAD